MFETDATSLPRLMVCNGSRLLGGFSPPSDDDTSARDEGIAAHWVVIQVAKFGVNVADLVNTKAPNGVTVTNGILALVSDFLNCIQTQKNTAIFQEIEFPMSFGSNAYRVQCRPDHIAFNGATLWVDDLKTGYRIIEPEHNWTLIAHAVAWCLQTGNRPETIVLTVHQPRAPHPAGTVRDWSIDFKTLNELYGQISNTLTNPANTLVSGPHCLKCPNVTVCPANRNAVFNAVDISLSAYSENILDEDLAEELDILAAAELRLKERRKQLSDLALFRLKQGRVLPNYAVEKSYSNRAWNDGITCEFLEMVTGKKLAKPLEPVTPAQAQQAGVPELVVNQFSSRKETGLKLSRVSAETKAKRLFKGK